MGETHVPYGAVEILALEEYAEGRMPTYSWADINQRESTKKPHIFIHKRGTGHGTYYKRQRRKLKLESISHMYSK